MAEVSRLTGFDRATTRRLCMTLQDDGYLHKTDRVLRLAPKILAIAGGYLTSNDFGHRVQPVLNQYAEEFEGEIALAMQDGDRAIYVARSAISSARVSFWFFRLAARCRCCQQPWGGCCWHMVQMQIKRRHSPD